MSSFYTTKNLRKSQEQEKGKPKFDISNIKKLVSDVQNQFKNKIFKENVKKSLKEYTTKTENIIKDLINKPNSPLRNITNVDGSEKGKFHMIKKKLEEHFNFTHFNFIEKDLYPSADLEKIKRRIHMKNNDTNPEILKIKSLIHPKKNQQNSEILKIKSLIHPQKNSSKNAEVEKIKALINPKKYQKNKKEVKKPAKPQQEKEKVSNKTQVEKVILSNKEADKQKAINQTKNKMESHLEKLKSKKNEEEKEEENLEQKIKQRFNKTKTEILKKLNTTEIKKIKIAEKVNNKLKHHAAMSLKNAVDRLKKEISAELKKESNEDKLAQVSSLFRLKIEQYSQDFRKAASELKAEISADILKKNSQEEILEKARAIYILENIEKSSIDEKKMTSDTIKKIVFEMMKEKNSKKSENSEDDFARKADLARAFDKLVDLRRQEIAKNLMEDELNKSMVTDIFEKEKVFELLREAKDEADSAIDQINKERKLDVKGFIKKEARRGNLRRQ